MRRRAKPHDDGPRGSDDAGAVPFRGDLCRTAASKKRTRIALQLDDGTELLARAIENAS